jgi:hypothetical protein
MTSITDLGTEHMALLRRFRSSDMIDEETKRVRVHPFSEKVGNLQ